MSNCEFLTNFNINNFKLKKNEILINKLVFIATKYGGHLYLIVKRNTRFYYGFEFNLNQHIINNSLTYLNTDENITINNFMGTVKNENMEKLNFTVKEHNDENNIDFNEKARYYEVILNYKDNITTNDFFVYEKEENGSIQNLIKTQFSQISGFIDRKFSIICLLYEFSAKIKNASCFHNTFNTTSFYNNQIYEKLYNNALKCYMDNKVILQKLTLKNFMVSLFQNYNNHLGYYYNIINNNLDEIKPVKPVNPNYNEINENFECAICLENHTTGLKTSCGHLFCNNDLLKCLTIKKECPLCRSKLDKIN